MSPKKTTVVVDGDIVGPICRSGESDRIVLGIQGKNGDGDRSLILWDCAKAEVCCHFNTDGVGTKAIDCSRDGRMVGALGMDGILRIWSASDGNELCRYSAAEDCSAECFRFSPDATELVVGGGQLVTAIEIPSMRVRSSIQADATSVAFSNNGRAVAIAERRSRRVTLWDGRGRAASKTFDRAPFEPIWVRFVADGDTLLVAELCAEQGKRDRSRLGLIQLDRIASESAARQFASISSIVLDVDTSFDGRAVMATTLRGELMVWRIERPQNTRKE